jgi:hypothetical protein
MTTSLKHYKYKHRNNKTMRKKLRKSRGGKRYGAFHGTKSTLDELEALLNNPDHHMLVKHYSKSCSHCKNLDPEWKSVVNRLSNVNPEFTIANLNPDATNYMNEHHYKNHKYDVNGFPTIVYINKIKNVKPKEYHGERTADAIMEWLAKIITDKRIKITIESGEEPESHEEGKYPASFQSPPSPFDQDQVEDSFPPASTQAEDALAPQSEDAFPPAPQSEDAFPPAPQSEDAFQPQEEPSTVNKLTGTIKNTASAIDDKIEKSVGAIKSAFTNDIDFEKMFSSADSAAPVAAAPVAAAPVAAAPVAAVAAAPVTNPEQPPVQKPALNPDLVPAPINAPQVPSLVGGRKKNRRYTRRKHRRSKSSKQSRSKK